MKQKYHVDRKVINGAWCWRPSGCDSCVFIQSRITACLECGNCSQML